MASTETNREPFLFLSCSPAIATDHVILPQFFLFRRLHSILQSSNLITNQSTSSGSLTIISTSVDNSWSDFQSDHTWSLVDIVINRTVTLVAQSAAFLFNLFYVSRPILHSNFAVQSFECRLVISSSEQKKMVLDTANFCRTHCRVLSSGEFNAWGAIGGRGPWTPIIWAQPQTPITGARHSPKTTIWPQYFSTAPPVHSMILELHMSICSESYTLPAVTVMLPW